jgi:hypothetical protein
MATVRVHLCIRRYIIPVLAVRFRSPLLDSSGLSPLSPFPCDLVSSGVGTFAGIVASALNAKWRGRERAPAGFRGHCGLWGVLKSCHPTGLHAAFGRFRQFGASFRRLMTLRRLLSPMCGCFLPSLAALILALVSGLILRRAASRPEASLRRVEPSGWSKVGQAKSSAYLLSSCGGDAPRSFLDRCVAR